jgi:hypothetical protein
VLLLLRLLRLLTLLLLLLLLGHGSEHFVASVRDEKSDVTGRHALEPLKQKVEEGRREAPAVHFPEDLVRRPPVRLQGRVGEGGAFREAEAPPRTEQLERHGWHGHGLQGFVVGGCSAY